ncbi:MAG: (2Fe-2S) ferredoxin domain-containing protein [Fusobacteriota bacterium]
MAKIKSLDDLKKLKGELQAKVNLREKGEKGEKAVQIKVGMATCGIASGAKETMDTFLEIVNEKDMDDVVITQTGCMGACHSEPTVEVTIPGKDPIVFGDVDEEKAKDIIEKYIENGELLDGIIPKNYKTIDEQ